MPPPKGREGSAPTDTYSAVELTADRVTARRLRLAPDASPVKIADAIGTDQTFARQRGISILSVVESEIREIRRSLALFLK